MYMRRGCLVISMRVNYLNIHWKICIIQTHCLCHIFLQKYSLLFSRCIVLKNKSLTVTLKLIMHISDIFIYS